MLPLILRGMRVPNVNVVRQVFTNVTAGPQFRRAHVRMMVGEGGNQVLVRLLFYFDMRDYTLHLIDRFRHFHRGTIGNQTLVVHNVRQTIQGRNIRRKD